LLSIYLSSQLIIVPVAFLVAMREAESLKMVANDERRTSICPLVRSTITPVLVALYPGTGISTLRLAISDSVYLFSLYFFVAASANEQTKQ
jgi:hypothetical protein